MKKRIPAFILAVTLFLLLMLTGCGKKTYKIAVDNNYSPFGFQEPDGTIGGFDTAIIKAIAETENFDIKITAGDLLDNLAELESGDVDMVIDAIIPDEDMIATFDFTAMYYNNEYAAAVRKGANDDLVQLFNEGLEKIKENGKYDELYKAYFGQIEE